MFCPNGALSEGDPAVPSHPLLEFQSPKKLPVAAAKTSFLGAQEGGYTQEPGFGPLPRGTDSLIWGGLAQWACTQSESQRWLWDSTHRAFSHQLIL